MHCMDLEEHHLYKAQLPLQEQEEPQKSQQGQAEL